MGAEDSTGHCTALLPTPSRAQCTWEHTQRHPCAAAVFGKQTNATDQIPAQRGVTVMNSAVSPAKKPITTWRRTDVFDVPDDEEESDEVSPPSSLDCSVEKPLCCDNSPKHPERLLRQSPGAKKYHRRMSNPEPWNEMPFHQPSPHFDVETVEWRVRLMKVLCTNSNCKGGGPILRQRVAEAREVAPDHLKESIDDFWTDFKINTVYPLWKKAYKILYPDRDPPARWAILRQRHAPGMKRKRSELSE